MSHVSKFVLASVLATMIAAGQTSGAATAGAPTLKSLTIEAIVPVSGLDAAATPNVPADTLASLTNGTLELRQQLSYSASANTLKVTGIVEAPGSPLPTPASAAGVTTLYSYTINVDRVDVTAKPGNAVVIVGSVSGDSAVTPFGDIAGALVSVSAGYKTSTTTASTTEFSRVSTNIAGAASLFSTKGSGTVSTGDATGSGLPVAVAGPKNFISGSPQFQLDATKSKDPSGGTLTYHWSFVPSFGSTVNLAGADTATPTVTVPDNSTAEGDYTFQLTVTNSAGLSAMDTVTVTYTPGHTDTSATTQE
jgi:hypothetical protein